LAYVVYQLHVSPTKYNAIYQVQPTQNFHSCCCIPTC